MFLTETYFFWDTYLLLQTSATIQTFFRAMVQYPEVQKLAQSEIDRVIGAARLPDLDDEAQLPFVTAVLYEVLRYASKISSRRSTV